MKMKSETGRTKKTLNLDPVTCKVLEDLNRLTGLGEGRLVEMAVNGGAIWDKMRKFGGIEGLHPYAEMLEPYQAFEDRMTGGQTEVYCDMVLSLMDCGGLRFRQDGECFALNGGPAADGGQMVDAWEKERRGLNEYIVYRISDAVAGISGGRFGEMRDLAASGNFVHADPALTKANLRDYLVTLRNHAYHELVIRNGFLIRAVIVVLRDAVHAANWEERGLMYRIAKERLGLP